MASSSFFVQSGMTTTTANTFQQLVDQALANAGAIGPKSVTIVNPTGYDDLMMFYVNAACTIQQITTSVKGSYSPSITFDIRFAPNPSDTGTSVVTGGTNVSQTQIVTSFNNATIPANSYVRVVTSNLTGDVDELAISIDF